MAKVNKEYKWRMEGMLYALKIAEEQGIDALRREIKTRGIMKLDIWARKEDVENLEFELSTNLYNNMLSTMMYTLHDVFGFAKGRLDKLKDAFDRNVGNIFNLDWVGDNYVRFEDYGKYLNEKYGYNFDVDRIAACGDVQLEKMPDYKRLDREETLEELKRGGFAEASEWLEKRIYDKEGMPAC